MKNEENKNKLLNAINEISKLVSLSSDKKMSNEEMDEKMFKILTILGQAGRADRCFVWINYNCKDSSLVFMRQLYEWSEGAESVQGSELIDHIVYEPELYDLLSAGKALNTIVKDLDDYNREILEAQAIKSILLAPIHIDGYFWGFIGFDNCHSEKLWESFEEEGLMSASLMVAKMIDRFVKNK